MRILTADQVLAGPGLTPVARGAVVIDHERIAWVGPERELAGHDFPASDADVVERYGDATILPGLIDAHVHLAFDGGKHPVARMQAEGDAMQVALMLSSARQLLSVGVTTARDLGSRDYLNVDVRDAVAAGTVRGPRIVAAGPPITVTGGHCWFMGAEVDSVDEMRRMVRRHHKARVDVIKLMSTGGNMTAGSAPWHAQFTTEELRVAVDEAHRLGKKVAAHAHGTEGIRRALEAGVDSLEHCSFQTEDGFGAADPELVARIAASGVVVSPTCNLRMPLFRELMPDRELALGELYRAGATVVASTDAGIDNTPHHGYVGGLEAMTTFGMPPRDVLAAATVVAARALGVDDVTGALSPGLEADILVVGGDPTLDIAALHELRRVFTRGTPFEPDDLPPIPPLDLAELPAFLRSKLEARAAGAPGAEPDDAPEQSGAEPELSGAGSTGSA
jgi:imidazolonepropionase-like amidohydrolase